MGEKISHMKLSEETHAPGVFSPEVDFPQLRRTEPRFRRHFGAGRFISYENPSRPHAPAPFSLRRAHLVRACCGNAGVGHLPAEVRVSGVPPFSPEGWFPQRV